MTDAIELTGIKILQTVPGKMQLRVPQLTSDAALAQQFEQLALKTAGVTSIHVDSSAASVIITHKPDAATTDRLRSRLATLVGRSAAPPAPLNAPQTPHPLPDTAPRNDLPPAPPKPSTSINDESPQVQRVIADLQQQLDTLQQQLAAQSDYQSLLHRCQQQSRVIADLQQQLDTLQAHRPEPEDIAQLRRLAAIGERQINKWQRRL